jgi:hypothetical protein
MAVRADVAELVDAHGSGPCGGDPVEVQVLSSASRDPPASAAPEQGFSFETIRMRKALTVDDEQWLRHLLEVSRTALERVRESPKPDAMLAEELEAFCVQLEERLRKAGA